MGQHNPHSICVFFSLLLFFFFKFWLGFFGIPLSLSLIFIRLFVNHHCRRNFRATTKQQQDLRTRAKNSPLNGGGGGLWEIDSLVPRRNLAHLNLIETATKNSTIHAISRVNSNISPINHSLQKIRGASLVDTFTGAEKKRERTKGGQQISSWTSSIQTSFYLHSQLIRRSEIDRLWGASWRIFRHPVSAKEEKEANQRTRGLSVRQDEGVLCGGGGRRHERQSKSAIQPKLRRNWHHMERVSGFPLENGIWTSLNALCKKVMSLFFTFSRTCQERERGGPDFWSVWECQG